MSMKKKLLIGLLTIASLNGEIQTQKTSQSFLFTRPIFNNLPAHTSFWHDSWFDIEKNNSYQLQMNYQRSINSAQLKRYFLLSERDKVIVRGSSHGDYSELTTDVRAEWLGLPNDFEGTVTLKPEQVQGCISISFRKSFGKLFDCDLFDRMWGFVDLPVVHIKNNLNFAQESVSNAAAASVAVRDIETAFNNTNWNYQKIKTTSENKTRLGHVRIGFGKTFLSEGRAHVATYSALSIPTTAKQNNQYLFQPQAGFNGHFAMIFGASFQLPLTRKTDKNDTCLFLEFENTALIRNKQHRTFDLKDKEWSRFLLLREKDQTSNVTTPGVNVLTQWVRVSSYSLIDVAGGVRFNVGKAQAELGLGVWGRSKERLKLTSAWKETYGIAGSTTDTSASASTIKTLGSDDGTFTPITEKDLDFDSAAALATVLYRVHGSIGARGRGENANGLCGCGFFVEIPRNKTKAFTQWGVWAKVGGAF